MATRTRKKKTDRAENKAARQERRDEIRARWNQRTALRMAEDHALIHGKVGIDVFLYLSKFAPMVDLVAAANFPGERLEQYVAHLLRIVALKEMPYDEYLQTEEWKARAAHAKKRYEGQCALDATHAAVDAHHRTYERRGREHANDLIPLCRQCHDAFHKRS